MARERIRTRPLIPTPGDMRTADPRDALDEATETSWQKHLADFEQSIYPVLFAPRGISLGDALMLWELSGINNRLNLVLEEFE